MDESGKYYIVVTPLYEHQLPTGIWYGSEVAAQQARDAMQRVHPNMGWTIKTLVEDGTPKGDRKDNDAD